MDNKELLDVYETIRSQEEKIYKLQASLQALWKALITLARSLKTSPDEADVAGLQFGWRRSARDVIEEVLAEHRGA